MKPKFSNKYAKIAYFSFLYLFLLIEAKSFAQYVVNQQFVSYVGINAYPQALLSLEEDKLLIAQTAMGIDVFDLVPTSENSVLLRQEKIQLLNSRTIGHKIGLTYSLLKLNDKTIVSAHFDGSIKVWDINHPIAMVIPDEPLIVLEHGQAVTALLPLSENRLVSAGGNAIKIWNLNNSELEREIILEDALDIISIGNGLIAVIFPNMIQILHIESGLKSTLEIQEGEKISQITSLGDGLVAFGGSFNYIGLSNAGLVKIWDLNNHREPIIKTIFAYLTPIKCLKAISKKIIATAAFGSLKIWDIENEENPLMQEIISTQEVLALESISNGFISVDNANVVKIWQKA